MIKYKRTHAEIPPLTASAEVKLDSVLQYLANIQLDNVNTRLDILTDKLDKLLDRPTPQATVLGRVARAPWGKEDWDRFRNLHMKVSFGY